MAIANSAGQRSLARQQGIESRRSADQQGSINQRLQDSNNRDQAIMQARQGRDSKEQARIAAAAQVASAQMGAQANILGSLFGSIGSGNPNYRYW